MSSNQRSKNQNRRSGRRGRDQPKKPDGPKQLVMLTHGKDTNFAAWREAMRDRVALDYGILVSIIDDGLYALPADIDPDDFQLGEALDPFGINREKLKIKINNREKTISKCEENEPKMRALMWRYMTRDPPAQRLF